MEAGAMTTDAAGMTETEEVEAGRWRTLEGGDRLGNGFLEPSARADLREDFLRVRAEREAAGVDALWTGM
jgi:hypothetical protein